MASPVVSGGRPAGFEVLAQVHFAIDDDVEKAADLVRRNVALFVGGMGLAGAELPLRDAGPDRVRGRVRTDSELWAEGDREGAAASIPLKMIEAIALVGPLDKIRGECPAWRESCITLMLPMLNGRQWDVDLVGRWPRSS